MGKRKTGSILKRGSVWWIYYTVGGKRLAKPTGARTKTEAQHILNKHLPREIDFDQRGKISLGEFTSGWIERRKAFLKPSVYDSYASIVKHHILPYFGNTSLNRIFAGDVEAFVVHLSEKRGKGKRSLSPKSVNNILIVLHRIMSDARDDRRIEHNPVIIRKHRLSYTHPEKDHFSIEEMNLFLEQVTPDYRPFFITAWHTGLRLGELVGLKWEDVDWARRALIIRRSVYQAKSQNIVTAPKTSSGRRVIFMTPFLFETLKEYKEQKKLNTIEGYLFEKDGKPYNKDGIVRSQFKQALRKSGLRKTLTPHSIRHGLISVMRAHFPEHIVKRLAGHSLGNNVTEMYTHVTDEQMQEYATLLGYVLQEKSFLAERRIGTYQVK